MFVCCDPKLGAEDTRPLQQKVRDPFTVSKTVVNHREEYRFCSFNDVLLFCQEGAGLLEEHVYMAGDQTARGLWPVTSGRVLPCVMMNNCCRVVPLSVTTLFGPYPCLSPVIVGLTRCTPRRLQQFTLPHRTTT